MSLIIPQLAAVREDGTIGCELLCKHENDPATSAFMFTSEENFQKFASSNPNVKLEMKQLDYPSLLELLKTSRERLHIDYVILDYTYTNDQRRSKRFLLFDIKEGIQVLEKWKPNGYLLHPLVQEMTAIYP